MNKNLLPEDITIDNIHTLSSDTFEALEKEKLNQAQLVARRELEEEKIRTEREYRKEQISSVRKHKIHNILLLLCGTVALIGVALFVLNFVNNQSQITPVVPVPEEVTLIPFNFKKDIVLSAADIGNREELRSKILNNGTVSSEGITYFKLSPELRDMFAVISPSMSIELRRTFTEIFWGGNMEGNFLIIEVEAYDRAFAGMLEWEQLMHNDLSPFIGTTVVSPMPFVDRVIENKDVRMLLGDREEVIFLYGFFEQNILIVAKNEEVFKSVYDTLLRRNL